MSTQSKKTVLTGIRATGKLTLGNVIGAVIPLIELLSKKDSTNFVFVADLHSLTDNSAKVVTDERNEILKDYLAFGLNDLNVNLFLQSAIQEETAYLTLLLLRHTTFNELARVPTLKDKMKSNQSEAQVNMMLVTYPVMMAADILIHKATIIPVGKDQVPHIEYARNVAVKFNNEFGDFFPTPKVQDMPNLNVLSLKGSGKMSKSIPEGAIFLSDSPEVIKKKVQSAETSVEGKTSPNLENLILIGKSLSKDVSVHTEIDAIFKRHMDGEKVTGLLKQLVAKIIIDFTSDFQKKRALITDQDVESALEAGNLAAKESARKTITEINKNFLGLES